MRSTYILQILNIYQVQKMNYIAMTKRHNPTASAAYIHIEPIARKKDTDRCNYMNSTILAFALVATIFGILLAASSTYAQTSGATMNKVTSGGSLKVILQLSPYPVIKGKQTNFKVTFDQNGSSAVQPHIDYDLTIMKDDKQVFQASVLAGHPNQPLHTAEGIVTIPYTFQQPGGYMMNITAYGILFNPIRPEAAQFPISVS
jgi:hypothetical protein